MPGASLLSALCSLPMLLLGIATLAHARAGIPAWEAPTMPSALYAAEPPAAEPVASDDVSVARAVDGMFYLNSRVNDGSVRFLVDTGASTVVLTPADARAIGLDVSERDFNQQIRTAGGRARMASVRIDRMEFGGRTIDNVEAAVIEDGIGVSLLGQNVLSRLERLSIEGDRLTLR